MAVEWDDDVTAREGEWIVKELLPDTGLAAIYGPSRAGKSFLAIDWGMRIAHRQEVLGAKTRRSGVAYIATEAANGVRKRIRAWRQEHVQDGEGIFTPFALIARSVDFSNPATPDVDEIIQLLQDTQVEFKERGGSLGVVFVDTLARAMPGADENSIADMSAARAALERIGRELGVLVCVVHHTGKDQGRGPRGHSSLFADIDTAVELTYDEETGVRTFKIVKQKDDEDGRSWGFRLRRVVLGEDADGDDITSCVIDLTGPASSQPKRRDKALAASEQILLSALKAVLSTDGRTAPAGVPAPRGTTVAPYAKVRERAFEIGLSMEGEVRSAKHNRWNRALEKLAAANVVGVWAPDDAQEKWLWLR